MNNMILPLQLIINGNKNYYSIGDYISNFNLRKNESLYLYNNFTNMLKDSIKISRMSDIETYGKYLNSNTFVFYNNSNNIRKKTTY